MRTKSVSKPAVHVAFAIVLPPSVALMTALAPTLASAETLNSEIHAQVVADDLVAANPELVDVIFHITPPSKTKNVVVAAHLRKATGEASDKDDLGVEKTGKPLVEVQKDQVRIGVLVPLKDAKKKTIGAVGLMYRYQKGDAESKFLAESEKIRDELAKKISSKEALFKTEVVPLIAEASMPIPGKSGRFDFMTFDSARGRVLAAHKEAGTLEVFDAAKNQLVSSVKVGEAQGVYADQANDLYFVGSAAEKKVSVINASTLAIMGEVRVDGQVDAVTYDTKSKRIFAAEDDGNRIWVINPKTMKLESTIKIPGVPEVMEYDTATDRVYLNIKNTDQLVVINPSTAKVEAEWSTLPVRSPHGLVLDSQAGRAYVAGSNGQLAAIDLATGKVVGTSAVEKGVDQIAYDLQKKIVYSAAKGFISATSVATDKLESLGQVIAPAGAHTIAQDSKSHSAWISFATPEKNYLEEFKPAVQ